MTTTSVKKRVYTPEEVETALSAHVLESGRSKQVVALLKEAGFDIPIATIRTWAYRTKREQYETLKSQLHSHVDSQLGDTFSRLATMSGEIAEEALKQIKEHLDNGQMDPKELSKVLHESMVAAGISTEKAQLLAGKPTERIAVDFGEIKRTLEERHGVKLGFIDGTATEEPDPPQLDQEGSDD